jgi:hypothetical protein
MVCVLGMAKLNLAGIKLLAKSKVLWYGREGFILIVLVTASTFIDIAVWFCLRTYFRQGGNQPLM